MVVYFEKESNFRLAAAGLGGENRLLIKNTIKTLAEFWNFGGKMSGRPVIYMSRCFGFEKCRYDGKDFFCEFAENLKKHAEIIHWCPETAIGLGCPREKIRVVKIDGKNLLFQPETGKFFTEKMIETSNNYLKTLGNIDGFFLKAKSPSCGVKNTKLYRGKSDELISTDASGFFALQVMKLFPNVPVLTEEDLKDEAKTKDFLEKVFGETVSVKLK